MSSSSRSKSLQIVVRPNASRNQNGKARARNRQRPRKRGAASRPKNNKTFSNLTSCYAQSLVDPFEYAGCKLGWGCFSPSRVGTAYLRGASVANADGSWAIAALPNAFQMAGIWAGGLGVGQNVYANSSDLAAVSNNFQAGRPISIGVRIIPSLAMTSAPGFIYAGLLCDTTYTRMQALPTGELVTLASSQLLGNANIGASCTGRPFEPTCFNFHSGCVNGTGHDVNTSMPFGVPYIVVTGLPATGIPIAFEIAFNFEGLANQLHGQAPLGQQKDSEASLASEWVSYDSMWRAVQGSLPSFGRAYENIASVDANLFGGAMGRRAVRYVGDYLQRATGRTRNTFPSITMQN